jgi:deoxyribose-phosphate aldolase
MIYIESKLIVSTIDHTNLTATASKDEVAALCRQAAEYRFAAVCINPWHVHHAARLLEGTGVNVAAVAGFPLGANTTTSKVFEAGEAVQNGAAEIDLVINIAALKEGMKRYIAEELSRVRRVSEGALLKVILETALLSDEEKREAATLAQDAGADMVKTSTGFNGGATVEDILLLREIVPQLGVKASGGIREASFALQLLAAGATRLGTSNAIKIMQELESLS